MNSRSASRSSVTGEASAGMGILLFSGSVRVDVKVTQAGDFSAVVNDFPVDVQDELAHRVIGVRSFVWAARRRECRPLESGRPAEVEVRGREQEVDRAVAMHGPAVFHRLPGVLVIGQPVEAGPELASPVEVELVGQLRGDVHEVTLSGITDSSCPMTVQVWLT